jgi:hypothetical protein
MQFVKGKPPETQYTTHPEARAKRREVALGRPGFEPGRIRAWLSLGPSQGHLSDMQCHVSSREHVCCMNVENVTRYVGNTGDFV